MPFWTVDPVLTIDEERIRNIDPQNPENLFGLWSVLSRASGVIEEGKRLENLSWRLWCHETLYCSRPRRTHPSAHRLAARKPAFTGQDVAKVPELSSSLDSVESTDSEAEEDRASSLPARHLSEPWSIITATDSHRPKKSKRRDNHITPGHLSQLVTCIKEKKDLIGPLSHSEVCLHDTPHRDEELVEETDTPDHARTPRPSSPRPIANKSSTSTVDSVADSLASHGTNATTSSEASSHAVVHGFQLGGAGRSSYKSQSQLAPLHQPILKNSNATAARSAGSRKKAGFQLGSSSDEDSVRDSLPLRMQGYPKTAQTKKQTSFKEDVEEIEPAGAAGKQPKFHLGHDTEDDDDSDAIETDDDEISDDEDDDEEISESAIEDDEDGWEDDPEERDEPRALDFHRVDSKPNLVSRRSLLTIQVHEGQRAAALEDAAMRATPPGIRRSRTSMPNGPLVCTSPDDTMRSMAYHASSSALTTAQPIIPTTTNVHNIAPMALSPRTNRRNMLASELGSSLRKHLLWERQQRNPAAVGTTSALPRRHTTHDLKNAVQYPDAAGGSDVAQKVHLANGSSKAGTRNNSWNDYFDNGLGEYHQKGW